MQPLFNMVDGAYIPYNNRKFDTAPCCLHPFHFTIDNGDKGHHIPYSGYIYKNNNNYFKNDFVNNYISIKYFLKMDKKYFTKEQLKKLEVAEYHFATAVNANYKRGTQRALNEMLADEYEKATGEKINRNWSCANCCLNNFKVIGRLYFESKKYYEKTLDQVQNTPTTIVPDNTQQVQEETEANDTLTKGLQQEQHGWQQLTFNFEGANNDAVEPEPEPAPENKPSTKKVTGDIDQVQNTPATIVPDNTQQVQEETEVKQTKSKVFNKMKNKAGRPKKQK